MSKRKKSGNMRYRLSFIFGCVVPLFFKAKDKSICERKKQKNNACSASGSQGTHRICNCYFIEYMDSPCKGNVGCLQFTWGNQSAHGLGKCQAKFRTDKFPTGIAFTICSNQFHLPNNGRESVRWL